MNRPSNCCSNNQSGASLLRKIQEVDFALYETALYLDAYPNCAEALNYYHSLVAQQKALTAQYEHEIGPITFSGNTNRSSWDWIKSPWPWQI